MRVFNQNTFEPWPLEDKSVQAIITSPPYWGLRKYDIPDIEIGGWRGQHGLEPDYKMFIEHTLLWASEAYRVLKDDGILFINLGDTYGGSCQGWDNKNDKNRYSWSQGKEDYIPPPQAKFKKGSKLLIPHRVAIALIDEGWYLRSDIVWHKLNGMPESVKNRFIKRHESIFMFTKSPKYHFDLDAVRVPYAPSSLGRTERGYTKSGVPGAASPDGRAIKCRSYKVNPKGANPGDVWAFPASNSVDTEHYAMYPEEMVDRMIKSSTRPGDVVLDPFCGSGTTLRAAEKLNRKGLGIDLGYEDVQAKRLCNIQKEMVY